MYDEKDSDGKRRYIRHVEECIAYRAVHGLLTGSTIVPARAKKIRKDRYKPEKIQAEASICLNCTKEHCDGSRKCFEREYKKIHGQENKDNDE